MRSGDKDAPESVHLCNFPVFDESMIDNKLEADMKAVLKAVVMGRACRNSANIKNRQPIGKMYLKGDFTFDDNFKAVIEDELNIKEIIVTEDVRDFTTYQFKPQMRTVGPKYGKLLNAIKLALLELDGNAAMDELNEKEVLKLDIDGETVELTREDLLIEMTQMEGYVSESDNAATVVIDTNLTEDLIEEGFVREIISKVQTMRKEAGFEVMDKIRLAFWNNEKIAGIAETNKEEIMSEVLATEVVLDKADGFEKEWNINGENVIMSVKKM